MWPFKKKLAPELPVDPVVDEVKRRINVAAEDAKRNSKRLNLQFTENHITLTILRTAGGDRRGR